MESGWGERKLNKEIEKNIEEKAKEQRTICPNLYQKIEVQSSCLNFVASNKNGEEVEKMLKKGANPNAQDEYGDSALHCAAERTDFGMMKILLEYGANPKLRKTRTKETPFHSLLRRTLATEEMVQLFLEHGADCTLKNDKGKNAVHIFHEHYNSLSNKDFMEKVANSGVFELLVKYGSNPDEKDYAGYTLLHREIEREASGKETLLLGRLFENIKLQRQHQPEKFRKTFSLHPPPILLGQHQNPGGEKQRIQTVAQLLLQK